MGEMHNSENHNESLKEQKKEVEAKNNEEPKKQTGDADDAEDGNESQGEIQSDFDAGKKKHESSNEQILCKIEGTLKTPTTQSDNGARSTPAATNAAIANPSVGQEAVNQTMSAGSVLCPNEPSNEKMSLKMDGVTLAVTPAAIANDSVGKLAVKQITSNGTIPLTDDSEKDNVSVTIQKQDISECKKSKKKKKNKKSKKQKNDQKDLLEASGVCNKNQT